MEICPRRQIRRTLNHKQPGQKQGCYSRVQGGVKLLERKTAAHIQMSMGCFLFSVMMFHIPFTFPFPKRLSELYLPRMALYAL